MAVVLILLISADSVFASLFSGITRLFGHINIIGTFNFIFRLAIIIAVYVLSLSFILKLQKNKEVDSDIRLLSIAVTEEKEGKGVSTSLVKNFEKGVENIGGKRYGLTVHDDNIHALNFYRKMGFIKDAQTGKLVLMTKILMMEESVIRKR